MNQEYSCPIWLQDTKPNWAIQRIKYATYLKARVGWHGLTSNEYLNKGVLLITGTDFENGRINWKICYRVSEERYQQDPYIQIQEGDLLITKDGTIGKVALIQGLNEPATLNSGIFVTRPLKGTYSNHFMYWLLKSKVFQTFIDYIKVGTTINHLYQNQLSDFAFPVPSLEIQQAIASFLDRKTAAIDTLIAKKQRLIQLLEEKRTALINQAVTQGLNPNVPMKNSGIAWISKIPEHWEVSRLSFLSTTIQTGPFGSQLHASEYVENGIPLVNPINIQRGNIVADYQKTVNQEVAIRLSRHKLLIGDLVFARRGELGRCGVINKNNNGWLCGTGCIQVRVSKIKVYPDYLNLFISIPWVASWLSLESVGSTMDNLNTEILSTLPIILPPKEEQIKIFQYIELKKYLFDKLITTIDRQISKLQEYRQSLITAAVTGKIDISEEVAA
ncbi:restriction endonuclease subunit S [Nostoc sp.]|uniref:restriction endonuclease subunit S n=1 Tax=Nostoc sp. TaxID=1180 RepID=UPI002FFB7E3F